MIPEGMPAERERFFKMTSEVSLSLVNYIVPYLSNKKKKIKNYLRGARPFPDPLVIYIPHLPRKCGRSQNTRGILEGCRKNTERKREYRYYPKPRNVGGHRWDAARILAKNHETTSHIKAAETKKHQKNAGKTPEGHRTNPRAHYPIPTITQKWRKPRKGMPRYTLLSHVWFAKVAITMEHRTYARDPKIYIRPLSIKHCSTPEWRQEWTASKARQARSRKQGVVS